MTGMKDLLGDVPFPSPHPTRAFDGDTYNFKRDHGRLKKQLEGVFELMKDGRPRTLGTISNLVGGSEASISARLRDLRKVQYGAHIVERQYKVGGIWEYRVVVNT